MTLPEKPNDLTEEEWKQLLQWYLDSNTTIIPHPVIKPEDEKE